MRVLLLALLILAAACTPRVKTSVLLPANFPHAAEPKTVAVMPFSGNMGAQASVALESALSSVKVDGREYFTIVDRVALQNIVDEQNLAISGLTESGDLMRVGALTGAEGIYTGYAYFDTETSHFHRKVTRCAQRDKDNKCVQWGEYNEPCTRVSVSVSLNPRLTDVSTGRVLFSYKYTKNRSAEKCASDTYYSLPSSSELKNRALNAMINEFITDVAPHTVVIEIKLMKSPAPEDKKAEELLKAGISFAEENRMDRACRLWREAEVIGRSAALLHNIGVCEETEGNYNEALNYYNSADRMLMEPEDILNESLRRIKNRLREVEELEAQLAK
ncbi:CsgG/HfaB family protein [Limisalsivibrio acetivorans]|uniref:CsgG/HfaB family protein n=1 Tax=Limisalsivibrio acetivorans TaxID=1304888 RepID=UPI0003B6A495|nr:CsgG/HfaB family protein [Limisalsivibrio acetivorans]